MSTKKTFHTYRFIKDRLTPDELVAVKKGDTPGYLKDKIDKISIVLNEQLKLKVSPDHIIEIVQNNFLAEKTVFIFKRAAEQPDTPEGNDPTGESYGDWQYAPYPSETEGDQLWFSVGNFLGEDLVGTWSVPISLSAEHSSTLVTIYKVTSTDTPPTAPTEINPAGWSMDYTTLSGWDIEGSYIWASQAAVTGFDGTLWTGTLTSWSEPWLFKIVGVPEQVYIFRRAANIPNTPTEIDPVPESWSYGDWKYAPYPSEASGDLLWMSKAIIFGGNFIEPWSTPIAIDTVGPGYFKKHIFKASPISLTDEQYRPDPVTSPPGWYDDPQTAVEANGEYPVYVSIGVLKVFSDPADNFLVGQWSIPFKYSGEDGEDGQDSIIGYTSVSGGDTWHRDKYGVWNPATVTKTITIDFVQGSDIILSGTQDVTRDSEGNITVSASSIPVGISTVVSGSGTRNITIEYIHDASGAKTRQTVSSIIDGDDGLSVYTEYLYKVTEASDPLLTEEDIPEVLDYNLTTNEFSGDLGNWVETFPGVPTSTSIVWRIDTKLVASPSIGTPVIQVYRENWNGPEIIAYGTEDGDDGDDGATVVVEKLYKRTHINTELTDSDRPIDLEYNTEDLLFLGDLQGWTETIPGNEGLIGPSAIWEIKTKIIFIDNVVLIVPQENWSTPVKISEDGVDGDDGYSIVTEYLYRRTPIGTILTAENRPIDLEYNTETLEFLGDHTDLDGWHTEAVEKEEGDDGVTVLWMIKTKIIFSENQVIVIPQESWSVPKRIVQDGEPGYTVVYETLYKRTTYEEVLTASDRPVDLSYNTETASFIGDTDGWHTTIPPKEIAGSSAIWEIRTRIFFKEDQVILIPQEDWSIPRMIAQDGQDGYTVYTEFLFKRTPYDVNLLPADRPVDLSYDTATRTFSGTMDDWQQSVPDMVLPSDRIWMIQTKIFALGDQSIVVPQSDWSIPVIFIQHGDTGPPGENAVYGIVKCATGFQWVKDNQGNFVPESETKEVEVQFLAAGAIVADGTFTVRRDAQGVISRDAQNLGAYISYADTNNNTKAYTVVFTHNTSGAEVGVTITTVQYGDIGPAGDSVAEVQIYIESQHPPTPPLEAQYDFDNLELQDAESWSTTIPELAHTPIWSSKATAKVSGEQRVSDFLVWSTPVKILSPAPQPIVATTLPSSYVYAKKTIGVPARQSYTLIRNIDTAPGAVLTTLTFEKAGESDVVRDIDLAAYTVSMLIKWVADFNEDKPFSSISARLETSNFPGSFTLVFSDPTGDFELSGSPGIGTTEILGTYREFRTSQEVSGISLGGSTVYVWHGDTLLTCPSTTIGEPTEDNTYTINNIMITPAEGMTYTTSLENSKFKLTPTTFPAENANILLVVRIKIDGTIHARLVNISYGKVGTLKGDDGYKGDRIEYRYRLHSGTPNPPDPPSPGTMGHWSLEIPNLDIGTAVDRIWVSFAYISASGTVTTAWSEPRVFSGNPGLRVKQIYKESSTQPTTPTGNSPETWTQTPPTEPNQSIWVSVGYFSSGGILVGGWTTPTIWSDRASLDFSELMSTMANEIEDLERDLQDLINRVVAIEAQLE